MELKLQKKEVKHLDIDGHSYEIDVKDTKAIEKLERWVQKQTLLKAFTVEDMKDCPALIDEILGAGAFEELFRGYEDSVAQYELCFTLHKIYKDDFLKDQIAEKDSQEKASLEQIDRLCDSMEKFNKAIDYASQKYGGSNAMARNKRPSNKRRY